MPRSKTPRRRDSGSGSVFERKATTRQGKVITRYVAVLELPPGPDGKRRRKTIYGKSRIDALERLRAAENDMRRIGNLPTSDPTLAQWCDLWLAEYGPKLKPTVLPGYRSKIETWIKPTIGRHKLSRLTPDHVRTLHKAMKEDGRKPNHVAGVHRVLASVLSAAMKEDKATRNVATIAGGGGTKKGTRRAMTPEQAVAVMVAGAETDPLGSRWPFAFLTGKRQGERLGLRWHLLDLDAGVADISWALAAVPWLHGCGDTCGKKAAWACPGRLLEIPEDYEHIGLDGNLILQRPKSEASTHLIPIIDFLVDPLRQRYEQVLLERPGYTVDHDLVWCRPDGRPLHPKDDWEMWKALLAAAKVPDFTQHEIRHTTVTLLMELGVDPTVIKQIVGHSDVLTQEAYKHVNLEFARRALDGLGTVLALPSTAASASR